MMGTQYGNVKYVKCINYIPSSNDKDLRSVDIPPKFLLEHGELDSQGYVSKGKCFMRDVHGVTITQNKIAKLPQYYFSSLCCSYRK